MANNETFLILHNHGMEGTWVVDAEDGLHI
jgi:hypothetical protein